MKGYGNGIYVAFEKEMLPTEYINVFRQTVTFGLSSDIRLPSDCLQTPQLPSDLSMHV